MLQNLVFPFFHDAVLNGAGLAEVLADCGEILRLGGCPGSPSRFGWINEAKPAVLQNDSFRICSDRHGIRGAGLWSFIWGSQKADSGNTANVTPTRS
jgi:hypothetical protein